MTQSIANKAPSKMTGAVGKNIISASWSGPGPMLVAQDQATGEESRADDGGRQGVVGAVIQRD